MSHNMHKIGQSLLLIVILSVLSATAFTFKGLTPSLAVKRRERAVKNLVRNPVRNPVSPMYSSPFDDFVDENNEQEEAKTWLDSMDALIDPTTPMEERPLLLQR